MFYCHSDFIQIEPLLSFFYTLQPIDFNVKIINLLLFASNNAYIKNMYVRICIHIFRALESIPDQPNY